MTTARPFDPFAPHGGASSSGSPRTRAGNDLPFPAAVRERLEALDDVDPDLVAAFLSQMVEAWEELSGADRREAMGEVAQLDEYSDDDLRAVLAEYAEQAADSNGGAPGDGLEPEPGAPDGNSGEGDATGAADGVPSPTAEQESEGTGEPMVGVEVPPDGTTAELVVADPAPSVSEADAVPFDPEATSTVVEVGGHRKVVPSVAADAVRYIGNADDDGEAKGRAVAVARVELGRPADKRRTSVLAAIAAAGVLIVAP